MKEKIEPFDFFEFLATEKDIQMFVDVAIDEAKNDTDPIHLADALAMAAEARRRLAQKGNAAEPSREITFNENTAIGEFDKTARLFGYHVTLAPIA